MKIRFAVVAAASTLVALPSWGQGIPVTGATNITISGLLAVGVDSSSIGQGNALAARPGLSTETHVNDNTSRLIVASTSKITEGWNIIFRVESRFITSTRPSDFASQGWADGDTWGGISSPYGSIIAGKSTLYYTDGISAGYLAPTLEMPGESYRIWDANGLGTFNLLSAVPTFTKTGLGAQSYTTGNGRSRSVVRYDSITFKPSGADLLDFSLAYSKNTAAAQNLYPGNTPNATYADNYESGQTTYARVRYNGYGFSFFASYIDQVVQGGLYAPASYTGPLDTKGTRAGISYKWNGLKVGVVYDNTSVANGVSLATPAINAVLGDAKRTVYQVPISYSFGDHGIYATYTKAGNTSDINDSGAKQLNFVYDYALTKRAFVGVFYTNITNGANGRYTGFLTGTVFGGSAANPAGTATSGESWRQIGVNLNYWF